MTYAQGRMRKKLLGAQEALRGGVARVCIGNDSLQAVLNGSGTTIARVAHEQSVPSTNEHGSESRQLDEIPAREMVSLS